MQLPNQKQYSQNFLLDPKLVHELLKNSPIGSTDTVLEIGPGNGIITQELLTIAEKVIAVEIDPQLYSNLQTKFAGRQNLELHLGDFLSYQLPTIPYKVFSNIPFRITGEIIRKLLDCQNSPESAFLIVQKEAAEKYLKNNLLPLMYKPFFDFEVVHKFKKEDFSPTPGVDIVLLVIQKRQAPLIANKDRKNYQDFLAYVFSRKKPYVIELPDDPTKLDLDFWLRSFQQFSQTGTTAKKRRVSGATEKLFSQQKRLQKIHRTRTARDWGGH